LVGVVVVGELGATAEGDDAAVEADLGAGEEKVGGRGREERHGADVDGDAGVVADGALVSHVEAAPGELVGADD
jgi:hypothetical protein